MLILKHQGRQQVQNRNEKTYREIWEGIEDEVDAKALLVSIGDYDVSKGYVTSIEKSQGEGRFYDLTIEYTLSYENLIGSTSATVVGVKSATLSTRTLQMPLQKLPNYRTKWNYYLIGIGDAATEIPPWWIDATSPIIPENDRKDYMWIKSLSEIPLDPNENGEYWNVVEENNFQCTPDKPGVEYYELSYYVVTERAKYPTATAAGNAVNKNINKITSPSNTFGITGGDWKLDSSNVSYDGQNWIAENVYTHSPDGWDRDFYTTA